MTEINGETSDGFHTFNELYEFRMLLNAALFNEWYYANLEHWKDYDYPCPHVYKSKLHSDGTVPFNDPNWFIVVAELPSVGQISFHYENKHWELFRFPESDLPPEYDGHSPQDSIIRLRSYLEK